MLQLSIEKHKRMFRLKRTYSNERDLIEACRDKNAKAQEALYEQFSPKMLGVCLRYLPDRNDAEDAMIAGMVKVFENLHRFEAKGSFEGWIRRICVNEALTLLRKKSKMLWDEVEKADKEKFETDTEANLEAEELLKLVQNLPAGYRTVFNLYAIEGYSHQEIAGALGITESTSKSQLNRARNFLKKMIAEQYQIKSYESGI